MRGLILALILCSSIFGQTESSPPKLSEVGNGELPSGLLEAQIEDVHKQRIEALRTYVAALQQRFNSGIDNLPLLIEGQLELVNAHLDVAKTKKERLDGIVECQKLALISWQQVNDRNKVGAKGGDVASEARARAHVLKFRAMWLKESASSDP